MVTALPLPGARGNSCCASPRATMRRHVELNSVQRRSEVEPLIRFFAPLLIRKCFPVLILTSHCGRLQAWNSFPFLSQLNPGRRYRPFLLQRYRLILPYSEGSFSRWMCKNPDLPFLVASRQSSFIFFVSPPPQSSDRVRWQEK